MTDQTIPASERAAYYVKAQSWADDIHGALRASRRRAYIVAGAAAAIAMFEAVALVVLMPLKTVVPYTVTVDRQTGTIETAQGVNPGPLSQNAAVTQAFLAQYVLARETFDVTDVQSNYQKVAAWTSGDARNQYIALMQVSNRNSPENVNPPGTVVKTIVKSISLLSPTSALVRFDAERTIGTAPAQRQPFTAVIAFRFTGAPLRMEDRFLNPLGFQVTSYRRDTEIPAPVIEGSLAR